MLLFNDIFLKFALRASCARRNPRPMSELLGSSPMLDVYDELGHQPCDNVTWTSSHVAPSTMGKVTAMLSHG